MMQNQTKSNDTKPSVLKALIGLGNPGRKYYFTRHSIGFRILDALADQLNTHFSPLDNNLLEQATIPTVSGPVILIKPQTFMNDSGKIIPYLKKKNIKPEEIMVVHDELELPLATMKMRFGGSHKGHNGLKSIIEYLGTPDFWRFRFGIGRPERREDVSDYVLEPFAEPTADIERLINDAVQQLSAVLTIS